MYSLSARSIFKKLSAEEAPKTQETKTQKPFPAFQKCLTDLATKASALYEEVNVAYQKLEAQTEDKQKLQKANEITLLVRDFRNYMKTALRVLPTLPIRIPFWLGGEKDEDEQYQSQYSQHEKEIDHTEARDVRDAFIEYQQKNGISTKGLFEDKQLGATYKKFKEWLQDPRAREKVLDRDTAEDYAKKVFESLGYSSAKRYSQSRQLSLFAANLSEPYEWSDRGKKENEPIESNDKNEEAIDQWTQFGKTLEGLKIEFVPLLQNTYKELSRAWSSEKFQKNQIRLKNFVEGRQGVGLIKMVQLFSDSVKTLLYGAVETEDGTERPVNKEEGEALEKERKELLAKGTEDAEKIAKDVPQSSEQSLKGFTSKLDEIIETKPAVAPLAKRIKDKVDEDLMDIIQIIDDAMKDKDKSQSEQFTGLLRDLNKTLLPSIDSATEILGTDPVTKEQIRALDETSENLIGAEQALAEYAKEQEEGVASFSPEIEDKFEEAKHIVETLTKEYEKKDPEQKKELLKKIQPLVSKEQELAKQIEPAKAKEDNTAFIGCRSLSRVAAAEPISLAPHISESPGSPASSLSTELQSLIDQAKEIAKEEGIIVEEQKTKQPTKRIDLKLDKMLTDMGGIFKGELNDQIGATSKILEGLTQAGIDLDAEKVTPLVEQSVNQFRTLYTKGIDEILNALARNNKAELEFFRGNEGIQQQIIDELTKKITESWTAIENDLIKGITEGIKKTAMVIRTLSLTAADTQAQKVQQVIKTYLDKGTIVNMLKDVFKKTIDKNRQDIKGLVEKTKEEIAEK